MLLSSIRDKVCSNVRRGDFLLHGTASRETWSSASPFPGEPPELLTETSAAPRYGAKAASANPTARPPTADWRAAGERPDETRSHDPSLFPLGQGREGEQQDQGIPDIHPFCLCREHTKRSGVPVPIYEHDGSAYGPAAHTAKRVDPLDRSWILPCAIGGNLRFVCEAESEQFRKSTKA